MAQIFRFIGEDRFLQYYSQTIGFNGLILSGLDGDQPGVVRS